jgi:short subunit fatty acids transporter
LCMHLQVHFEGLHFSSFNFAPLVLAMDLVLVPYIFLKALAKSSQSLR